MSKEPSAFYQKYGKRIFDLLLSAIIIAFLWPIFLIIGLLIKIDSPGPVIFRQKRTGKNGKTFIMYKFRTMVKNAEELKERYQNLNEADGPVFKIRNDPRFTKVGKFLSHTGLDELPQLVNILKGDMSLVGPRPLPINEEAKIGLIYRTIRQSVHPGLISSWLLNGKHNVTFNHWMHLDQKDILSSNIKHDLYLIIMVAPVFFRFLINALTGLKKTITFYR